MHTYSGQISRWEFHDPPYVCMSVRLCACESVCLSVCLCVSAECVCFRIAEVPAIVGCPRRFPFGTCVFSLAMGRQRSWKSAGGPEATIAALSKEIGPFMGQILAAGLDVYATTDFKAPKSPQHLAPFKILIRKLLELGDGHFDNTDVAEAIQICIVAKNLSDRLGELSIASCRPATDIVAMIALKIRVMVSHSRDAATTKKREPLHPFKNYRGEGEDDEDSESSDDQVNKDGEGPSLVSRYFDGKRAVELMSDGAEVKPENYEPGPDGFVVANFKTESLVTTLPNAFLGEDGELKPYEAAGQNPTGSKKGKKRARSEAQLKP